MANSQHNGLPRDSVAAVLGPALKVGAFTGTTGFLLGGTAGILKSTTPTLFATATGIQTFCLGSGFWATRSLLLSAWQRPQTPQAPGQEQGGSYSGLNASDIKTASAVAGASTGGIAGAVFRGRANVLPGAVMFGVFGWMGQALYDRWDGRVETESEGKGGFLRWLAERKWSPVTVMKEGEYEALLRKKMLNVEVELAVVEDKIAALREQQAKQEAQEQQALSSESK
ncbi:hypothetical protein MBLNU230_g4543t1 [Neophaeotheca triangularis]